MANKFSLLLFFLTISVVGICQTTPGKSRPRISYTAPDNSVWKCIKDDLNADKSLGELRYSHIPIKDSKGRSIEPGLVLTCSNLKNNMDPKTYSINALYQKPFQVNTKLLGGYPAYSSDKHSVVYKGDYERAGIKHLVIIGYVCYKGIAIEIIGDATADVFPKVQADFMQFVKSVKINE